MPKEAKKKIKKAKKREKKIRADSAADQGGSNEQVDILDAAIPETKKKGRLSKIWTRATVSLSSKELLLFTKYFTVLLNSGVAIDEALKILMTRSKGPLKKILTTLYNTIIDGEPFAVGLKKYPWVFSSVYVNLVGAGEESGTLVKSLEQLFVQMKKDIELKKKVQGALLYPSMILFAAIGISVGITVFVVPNVVGMFDSLNAELPLATRVLLWISDAVQNHGILMFVLTIALGVAVMALRKVPFVQPVTHFILLKLPLIGSIVRKVNLARIMQLLGTLLKSGISIDDSILITITVVKNVQYKRMLLDVREKVEGGVSFAESLEGYVHLVPAIPMQVVNVGERTGALDDMLLYLAEFYDEEVDDVMRVMTTLLEPILMIFIGLMVGGLALAIMTPIYSIVGQM